MVAAPHRRIGNVPVVDPDPVGRVVVVEDPLAPLPLQVGVPPGHRKIVQDDVVVAGASDRRLLADERVDLRTPFRFEQHLEHGNEKL
jgi:hypothetical protein